LSGGLQVLAVAGTNTVSFGIHADKTARSGLLGFAVERIDPPKDERYYAHGFKVFPSIVPQPDENTYVSTYVHPIQSPVWDDFTAEPAHQARWVIDPEPNDADRLAEAGYTPSRSCLRPSQDRRPATPRIRRSLAVITGVSHFRSAEGRKPTRQERLRILMRNARRAR
jgi:hypothetical protein